MRFVSSPGALFYSLDFKRKENWFAALFAFTLHFRRESKCSKFSTEKGRKTGH